MICRDDLRYTDDVIATLQSGNPLWYIANALDIPVEDVEYHYGEVMTMAHNGTVLPLRRAIVIDSTKDTTPSKTGRKQYMKTSMFPRDKSYYAERTATQVAEELGVNSRAVYAFASRYGYKLKYGRKGKKRFQIQWPADREWYESKTSYEVAVALDISTNTVRTYARRQGYKLIGRMRTIAWPTDPAYYEERTALQIAKEHVTQPEAVRHYCMNNGFTLKPETKPKPWPTDPQWYAERTRHQIADELGRTYTAAYQYVYRKNLKPVTRRTTEPT